MYILAFDNEMVAEALGEKYGAGGVEAGRNFLEKIIQVPLHLPPADRHTLRQFTYEGVEAALNVSGIALSEEEVYEFVHHFENGLDAGLTTPRQARRYANALMFALPILKGEVRPVDQLLIEGIRTFYPKLYLVIRENPDAFLSTYPHDMREERYRSKTVAIIDEGISGLYPLEQAAAKDLIQMLFPRLKGIFNDGRYYTSGFGADWDITWAKEQRLCSEKYFHRYFHYGVPPRDASDQEIKQFLATIETLPDTAVNEKIQELSSKNKAESFIFKLRVQEKVLEPNVAAILAVGLAKNAAQFPQWKGLFSSITAPFPQAAILVAKLVQLVPFGTARRHWHAQL